MTARAYLCSHEHISILANTIGPKRPQPIGQVLFAENIAAVIATFPGNTHGVGLNGFRWKPTYRRTPNDLITLTLAYMDQARMSPSWKGSEAETWCKDLLKDSLAVVVSVSPLTHARLDFYGIE